MSKGNFNNDLNMLPEETQVDPDLFNKNKPLFTTLKQKKQNDPSPK